MIKCGFGEMNITPSLGTPCSLGVDDEAEEIFDDIYTRVIALRDKNKILFIISAEVIGLSIEDIADIKKEISKTIGIKNFQMVVHTTHTHQAPLVKYHIFSAINKNGYKAISEEYYKYFLQQNAKAVKQALENIAELNSIGYGESDVHEIESNRRIITHDGNIIMRYSRPTEELKKYPEGHIDPKVRCLVLRRKEAKDIIWINYHGHPTSTGGDEAPYVTGDFPGWAIHILKKELPHYEYIYMTGPHGNLNPGKYVTEGCKIEDRKKDRNRMGKILSEGIKRTLECVEFKSVNKFRFLKKKIFLELNPNWPTKHQLEREYHDALKEIEDVHSKGKKVTSGGLIRMVQNKRYIYSILIDNVKIPSFVSCLRIGDYYAVFFPNEIFLEASDKIRKCYPEKKMLTFSMCDDAYSYIPTPEAYKEGGYEPSVSRFAPSSFNIVVETAKKLLEKLQK